MDPKVSAITDVGFVTTASLLICHITGSLNPVVNHTVLAVSVSLLFLLISIVLLDLVDKASHRSYAPSPAANETGTRAHLAWSGGA